MRIFRLNLVELIFLRWKELSLLINYETLMRNLFSCISESRAHISGLLEVTDLPNQKLRYIPVPGYLPKLSF